MKKTIQYFLLYIFAFTPTYTHAQSWHTVGSTGFSANYADYTSVALDGSGTPYVVYSDHGNGDKATVMKYNGSSWVVVGSAGFSAGWVEYTTIAIDGSGVPYVAYEDGGNGSKATVMKYNGSSWVAVGSAGLSVSQALSTSIAINGGVPYLVFEDWVSSGKATVMKYNGTGWVDVGVAGFTAGTATNTSIVINSSGVPYVAYQDQSTSILGQASVMKFDGTNWVTVGTAGFSPETAGFISMAISSSGTPYVAYVSDTMGFYGPPVVMKFNGTSWVNVGSPLPSSDQSLYTSIAIDPAGTPYVAYVDGAHGQKVTVRKFDGSNWVAVGPVGFSVSNTDYTSMAMDAGGIPYVAYEDFSTTIPGQATVMKLDTTTITFVKNFPGQEPSITLFPNPTHNSFTLHITSPTKENATITVTNTLGEKVKQLTTTTNTDTPIQLNTPPGIYFISALTKDGSMNQKIEIE